MKREDVKKTAWWVISLGFLAAACSSGDGTGSEQSGSLSTVTLSNGTSVGLYTPHGWLLTDYSASGLIAETEEDTIYALIDPTRVDGELIKNSGSDSAASEQFQSQIIEGGFVNILLSPVVPCAEALANLGTSDGEKITTDFLDSGTLNLVDIPEQDSESYSRPAPSHSLQSIRGLVALSNGTCTLANFDVRDPDPKRGADLLTKIAENSKVPA